MFLSYILKNKSLLVSLLIFYLCSICWIGFKVKERYPIYHIENKFYVTGTYVLDSNAVLPRQDGAVMLHNTEVLRMASYVHHPFLLNELRSNNDYRLDSLFEEEVNEYGSLEEAFNRNIKVKNINNTPFISILMNFPKDRDIAGRLVDTICSKINHRYNLDLWEEIDRQQIVLRNHVVKEDYAFKLDIAKQLFMARRPIVISRAIEERSSYPFDSIVGDLISFLLIPLLLINIYYQYSLTNQD